MTICYPSNFCLFKIVSLITWGKLKFGDFRHFLDSPLSSLAPSSLSLSLFVSSHTHSHSHTRIRALYLFLPLPPMMTPSPELMLKHFFSLSLSLTHALIFLSPISLCVHSFFLSLQMYLSRKKEIYYTSEANRQDATVLSDGGSKMIANGVPRTVVLY